jgi:hypothetical protein
MPHFEERLTADSKRICYQVCKGSLPSALRGPSGLGEMLYGWQHGLRGLSQGAPAGFMVGSTAYPGCRRERQLVLWFLP